MLATLRIKNLALVTDLTLSLRPGFNAITGETGAGKSIIIGALDLLLGERADRTLIRAGCESCSVEAVFGATSKGSPNLETFLEENGLEPCAGGELILETRFHRRRRQPPVYQRLAHYFECSRRGGPRIGGHARAARSSVAARSGAPAGHS